MENQKLVLNDFLADKPDFVVYDTYIDNGMIIADNIHSALFLSLIHILNKNRGYTVMANFHLRDKSLSLKAVGLLSKMLSFNDGWKFSTKGLLSLIHI